MSFRDVMYIIVPSEKITTITGKSINLLPETGTAIDDLSDDKRIKKITGTVTFVQALADGTDVIQKFAGANSAKPGVVSAVAGSAVVAIKLTYYANDDKSKANFARFLAKLANFAKNALNLTSRCADTNQSPSRNRNTGEKDNASSLRLTRS